MKRTNAEPAPGLCASTASTLVALVAAVAATAIATAAAVAVISGAGAGSTLATTIFIAAVLAAAASGLLAACIAGPPVPPPPETSATQIVVPLTAVLDGLKTLGQITKCRQPRPSRRRPPYKMRHLPDEPLPTAPLVKALSPSPSLAFHERCGRILQTCDLLVRHFPATRTLCILRTAEGIIARRPHRPVEPEPEPEPSTWEADIDIDLDPVLSAPNLDEALRRLDQSIQSAKKYERLQSTSLVLEAEKRRAIRSTAEQYLEDDALTPDLQLEQSPSESADNCIFQVDAGYIPKPKARSSLLQLSHPTDSESSHYLPFPETHETRLEEASSNAEEKDTGFTSSQNDFSSSFVEMNSEQIPESVTDSSVANESEAFSSSSLEKETENVALSSTLTQNEQVLMPSAEEEPEYVALPSALLENKTLPSILTENEALVSENEALSSTLTRNTAVPSVLTEDEALPSTLTEDETLPSILTEDETLPSILTEDEALPSILTEDETLPSILTEDEALPSILTEDETLPSILTDNEALPSVLTAKEDNSSSDEIEAGSFLPPTVQSSSPTANEDIVSLFVGENLSRYDDGKLENLPHSLTEINPVSSHSVSGEIADETHNLTECEVVPSSSVWEDIHAPLPEALSSMGIIPDNTPHPSEELPEEESAGLAYSSTFENGNLVLHETTENNPVSSSPNFTERDTLLSDEEPENNTSGEIKEIVGDKVPSAESPFESTDKDRKNIDFSTDSDSSETIEPIRKSQETDLSNTRGDEYSGISFVSDLLSPSSSKLILDLDLTDVVPSKIDQEFEQLLENISPPTEDIDKSFSAVSSGISALDTTVNETIPEERTDKIDTHVLPSAEDANEAERFSSLAEEAAPIERTILGENDSKILISDNESNFCSPDHEALESRQEEIDATDLQDCTPLDTSLDISKTEGAVESAGTISDQQEETPVQFTREDTSSVLIETTITEENKAYKKNTEEMQQPTGCSNDTETNFDREMQSFNFSSGAEIIPDCASDSSSMSVSPNPDISFFRKETNSATERREDLIKDDPPAARAVETSEFPQQATKKMDNFGFREPLVVVTARKVTTYVDDTYSFQKSKDDFVKKRRIRTCREDFESGDMPERKIGLVRPSIEKRDATKLYRFAPVNRELSPPEINISKPLKPEALRPFCEKEENRSKPERSPGSDALPGQFFRSLERRDDRPLTTFDQSLSFPLSMRVPHRRAFWDYKLKEPQSESPKRQPSIKLTGIVQKRKETFQTLSSSPDGSSLLTTDESDLPENHRRRFQEAKTFFQSLEGKGKAASPPPEPPASLIPTSTSREHPTTVAERFNVTGIYRDVLGDGAAKTSAGASLRGVPRRKAVVATLDSFRK